MAGVDQPSERARWHQLQSVLARIVLGRPLGVDVRREIDQARREHGSPQDPGLGVVLRLPTGPGEDH